jgi:hypothetical protein
MQLRNNLVIAVLIASLIAISPSLSRLDRAHESSTGCHEHSDKSPARDYDCCLTGHDVAAPQAFQIFRPAVESMDFSFPLSSTSSRVITLDTSAPLALHPPGETSLRI